MTYALRSIFQHVGWSCQIRMHSILSPWVCGHTTNTFLIETRTRVINPACSDHHTGGLSLWLASQRLAEQSTASNNQQANWLLFPHNSIIDHYLHVKQLPKIDNHLLTPKKNSDSVTSHVVQLHNLITYLATGTETICTNFPNITFDKYHKNITNPGYNTPRIRATKSAIG